MSKTLYSLLLCFCLSVGTVFAQNITVKGTVTSAEDGLPARLFHLRFSCYPKNVVIL